MSHPLARLLPGRTLAGRYAIHEPLGHGGMSIVFSATDRRLRREVAVKVLSIADRQEEDTVRERFRREASAAAGISPHPNVVQIYDFGTDEELVIEFLVMEHLRGEDLSQALTRGRLPGDLASRVLRDAARGIAAGHRAGIVHRDVKPGNIFLAGTPRSIEGVKILDFGIAKAMAQTDPSLTATGAVPHSPAYASPEQLTSAQVTPASDVFQLGLIGFEIWTGRRPFPSDPTPRLDAIRRGLDPDEASGEIPEPDRGALLVALSADPEARFPSAGDFLEALDEGREPRPRAERAEGAGRSPDAAAPPPADVPDEDETAIYAAETSGQSKRRPGRSPWPAAAHHWRSILVAAAGALLVFSLIRLAATGKQGLRAEDLEVLPAEIAEARAEMFLEAYDRHDRDAAADSVAVIRVIEDVHRAWERGEMTRHAAHFAPVVRFHDQTISRTEILEGSAALYDRYPDARIELSEFAVESIGDDRAVVSVLRDWSDRSGEDPWRTRAIQEYELAWVDGAWRITAEENVEVLHMERPRGDRE